MRVTEASVVALAVLVAGFSMAAGGVASAGAKRSNPPEIIQLSYSESSGDQGADRSLEAFARHTHGMHFATTYKGKKAGAPGRYRADITDTDIHGRKARHPWEPDRKQGGGDVVALVHKSLHHRGFADVRLRARKGGEGVAVRVRIKLKKCASDPPLYPLDCEVKVD
jgi:hypothetical protein